MHKSLDLCVNPFYFMVKYFYMTRQLLFFLFFLLFHRLPAQNTTLSGWISDAETGERLIGVAIQEVNSKRTAQTDNFGFFTLKCPAGRQQLDLVYLGYQRDTFSFFLQKDTALYLNLRPVQLREVVITAQKTNSVQSVGVLRIPVAELKSRPMLFGEPDIIKALAMTPGVKTGTEGSTGLYIRGGTPDQNYILLDGATVYNNSHLFGFVSVFNPDAIKSVSLYKGQMPARFGGRLSSVLDISMKEGNNQKRETELSVGLISSRFLTEGPIKKGKSSYLFSARSSYLGLLALPSRINYNNGNSSTYANYWMYDLNGKINFDLGHDSRFYLSFYSGKDYWKALSQGDYFGLNWGNQTASARYTRLLKGKVFWNAQATWNTYRYTNDQKSGSFNDSGTAGISISNRSNVQDINVKNTFQWAINRKNTLETGIEAGFQTLQPQAFYISDSATQQTAYRGNYAAFFVEDQIAVLPRVRLTTGIRLATFNTGGKNYLFPEPRVNLAYRVTENTSIEASWRINYQPVHLLTSNGVGLPNSIWVPATANVPPSKGEQWSIGANFRNERLGTTFTVETYYKTMSELLEFRQGLNFFNAGKSWENIVTGNGKGRAYGLELLLRKESGDYNGWISYTLAYNERQFNSINFGKWYPHQYDRRHELSITNNYLLSDRWSFSGNFVFTTGNAFTAPSYIAVNYDDSDIIQYTPVFLGKNNRRGPIYHRLDLAASRKHLGKKGRPVTWTFGVYNAYAHNNPFYIDAHLIQFAPDLFAAPDRLLIRYTVGSLFNFIPSISYAVKFK